MSLQQPTPNESAFAQFAWKLIERGISVVPIAPGSKRPGQWSSDSGWRGMSDWTRFAKRLPTDKELEIWNTWPDAGIGIVLGELSNLTGIDKDYDIPNGGNDALQAIIPYSQCVKKGEKGWTRFYQFNGERSCSFDVGGARVLDVLAEGRQTVVPPTTHPSGCSYVWISEESLDSILTTKELPKLPDDFLEQVSRVLEPYQTQQDIKHSKVPSPAKKDATAPINTDLSIQGQYFKDLNKSGLDRLEEWVPKIVPTSKPHNDGYRCIATWRGAKNPNVGINHGGIRDWGGGYGMTPIDLVMHANGLTFQKAAEMLRACLALSEPEPIKLTCRGQAPATPAILPWLKKVDTAPVMLPPDTSLDPAPAVPAFISNPPGILGDIARWITATAPKAQPELSVAAAIALCSVVMARTYKTQRDNFTSLYLVMVGKSGEGKEHPQACIDKVLTAAELSHLMGGAGYTSAGAVHSALLKSPAHLTTIDEMGKLLKMSRSSGQAHAEAAIDKLVEAFGRCHGVMRPPTYSTMTLSRTQSAQAEPKLVMNPGITILGATTPSTFYDNLTTDLVKDGFLGRCIVVESKQPRQLTQFFKSSPPPDNVVDWCKSVHVSGVLQGNLVATNPAEMPPTLIDLPMDEEVLAEFNRMEISMNDAKEKAESEDGLDVVLGRTLEKASRLAMIVAKARNIKAKSVHVSDFQWAFRYVNHYDTALLNAVYEKINVNKHDADMKRMVQYIKEAKRYSKDPKNAKYAHILKEGWLPHSMLLKRMHMTKKEFDSLAETAISAGLVGKFIGVDYQYVGDIYKLSEE